MTQPKTVVAESDTQYAPDGHPLCQFCPSRAVSHEATLLSSGTSPRHYRCAGHQRTAFAPNTVSGNITAADYAPVPERPSHREEMSLPTPITWVTSPDDPEVLWWLTGGPLNATIVENRALVPCSADYDLPHPHVTFQWEVTNDDEVTILASGTATSLREAQDACHSHLTARRSSSFGR